MLRTSRRQQIIQAAIGIIEQRSVEALTFESVAAAAGISKSGIIYHFPTRHDLLRGVNQHFIDQWETELQEVAGAPADQLTLAQRLRAVVVTLGGNADRAELLMSLESHDHPELPQMWAELEDQWMSTDPHSELYPVQLMALGLWAHDHVHHRALSEQERADLVATILDRLPKD